MIKILFINDLHKDLSHDTSIVLYTDDTKIWRTIFSDDDIVCLQNDINTLNLWAHSNLMKFHPDKCKVLTVHHTRNVYFGDDKNPVYSPYFLGNTALVSVGIEKDLGVDMSPKLRWDNQIDRLCSKASQKLGMLRRNCFFVRDKRRARTLYLVIVRSLFQHCSIIWRPANLTLNSKIESIQKKAVKWIYNEENVHYSGSDIYLKRCKELNLLPMCQRFEFVDIVMLFKIVNSLVSINLPSYLHFFSGNSRLRFCHLDTLSLVSDILPNTTANHNTNTITYTCMCLQLPIILLTGCKMAG